MDYSVKANSIVKDVVIHCYPCGHIRKMGGGPGKYGQVHWEDFDTLDAAEVCAKKWETKGHRKKYCSFCIKGSKTKVMQQTANSNLWGSDE